MNLIRNRAAMMQVLDSPLDPELKQLLRNHVERLAEYEDFDLGELGEFLIMEAGDSLADVERILGRPLVDRTSATFISSPEYALQHGQWLEGVWIISDDGFGLVLFAAMTSRTDPVLVLACRAALQATGDTDSG